jgi:hypothetical protein
MPLNNKRVKLMNKLSKHSMVYEIMPWNILALMWIIFRNYLISAKLIITWPGKSVPGHLVHHVSEKSYLHVMSFHSARRNSGKSYRRCFIFFISTENDRSVDTYTLIFTLWKGRTLKFCLLIYQTFLFVNIPCFTLSFLHIFRTSLTIPFSCYLSSFHWSCLRCQNKLNITDVIPTQRCWLENRILPVLLRVQWNCMFTYRSEK